MSGELIAAWLSRAATEISAERVHLTDLDSAIGDGDHGINLDRGFAAVAAQLAEAAAATGDAAGLLGLAGRTIMGTVGGASGALYGRAFLRAGDRLGAGRGRGSEVPGGDGDDPTGELDAIIGALAAAVDGIAALGRSEPGQKTMLDALVPALHALQRAKSNDLAVPDALALAAEAAEAGALATVPLIARRGRASYLGERSIGHQDPGATSSALMLRALADVARG